MSSNWREKLVLRRPAPQGELPVAPVMPGYYIGQLHFATTLCVAALVHMLGIYIINILPRPAVVDIPVRALSIKLGDGEPLSAEAVAAATPDSGNSTALENALSQIVTDDPMVEQAKAAASAIEQALANGGSANPVEQAIDQALANPESQLVLPLKEKKEESPKQFVRSSEAHAKPKETMGNSTEKEAELMSRYEQLISLWIEKFKQYPMDARTQGLQGETVVRIRIDRKGNVRYYLLERSTGHAILDRAAIDMVRRANPVPAVPNDYPKGDLIEFLIPVNFHLQ